MVVRTKPAFPVILAMAYCAVSLCRLDPAHGGQPGTCQRFPDNQSGWYELSFFSLKQGSALKNARMKLCDNGKLAFDIRGERLQGVAGIYSRDGVRFGATVSFSVHKGKKYRYVIRMDGIRLFEAYAGIARLQEYIEESRLTQEIIFLFSATHPRQPDPEENAFYLN